MDTFTLEVLRELSIKSWTLQSNGLAITPVTMFIMHLLSNAHMHAHAYMHKHMHTHGHAHTHTHTLGVRIHSLARRVASFHQVSSPEDRLLDIMNMPILYILLFSVNERAVL